LVDVSGNLYTNNASITSTPSTTAFKAETGETLFSSAGAFVRLFGTTGAQLRIKWNGGCSYNSSLGTYQFAFDAQLNKKSPGKLSVQVKGGTITYGNSNNTINFRTGYIVFNKDSETVSNFMLFLN
jgi:hypothetical protein